MIGVREGTIYPYPFTATLDVVVRMDRLTDRLTVKRVGRIIDRLEMGSGWAPAWALDGLLDGLRVGSGWALDGLWMGSGWAWVQYTTIHTIIFHAVASTVA
jgi:hypothetical protein